MGFDEPIGIEVDGAAPVERVWDAERADEIFDVARSGQGFEDSPSLSCPEACHWTRSDAAIEAEAPLALDTEPFFDHLCCEANVSADGEWIVDAD